MATTDVKKLFDLSVTANVLTMAMAGALTATGAITLDLYDRIQTFEPDQAENQKKADSTVSLATASYYIGLVAFFATSVLIGYQGGKGTEGLTAPSTKVSSGFQQAFAFVALSLLFATCSTGMAMKNTAATFGTNKVVVPTASAGYYRGVDKKKSIAPELHKYGMKRGVRADTRTDAEESEAKANSYYATYIAFIVIASIVLAIYLWYIAKYSRYAVLKGGKSVKSYARSPAVSEFFVY